MDVHVLVDDQEADKERPHQQLCAQANSVGYKESRKEKDTSLFSHRDLEKREEGGPKKKSEKKW